MRNKILAISLALATVGIAGSTVYVPQAQAQVRVSVDLFYRDLAPHGRWVEHPRYGWVWYPTQVSANWRPYTQGHWVWTEQYGWYWVSDERFGWATYHYGRWGYDDQYGWIWVPGTQWGPSWVAFRNSDTAIGWAPLPPDTLDMRDPRGGGIYIDLDASYYQPRWVFVPTRYFAAPRISSYVVPYTQNNVYIRQTTNVTNYVTINNYTVNKSIDPKRIEAATGRRIETVKVNQVNTVTGVTGGGGKGGINVYNPTIEKSDTAAPPPAARAKPTDRPKVAIQKDAVSPTEDRKGDKGGKTPDATSPTGSVTPTGTPAPGPGRGQGNDKGKPDDKGKPGATSPTGSVTPTPAPAPGPGRGQGNDKGKPDTTSPTGSVTPTPAPAPGPARGQGNDKGKPDDKDTGKPMSPTGNASPTAPATVTPAPTPSPAPAPGGGQGRGKPDDKDTGKAPGTTGSVTPAPAPAPAPGPAPGQGRSAGPAGGQGGGQQGVQPQGQGGAQGGQGGKPDNAGKGGNKPATDQAECGKPNQPPCR